MVGWGRDCDCAREFRTSLTRDRARKVFVSRSWHRRVECAGRSRSDDQAECRAPQVAQRHAPWGQDHRAFPRTPPRSSLRQESARTSLPRVGVRARDAPLAAARDAVRRSRTAASLAEPRHRCVWRSGWSRWHATSKRLDRQCRVDAEQESQAAETRAPPTHHSRHRQCPSEQVPREARSKSKR